MSAAASIDLPEGRDRTMPEQLQFEDLHVGDAFPTLTVTVTRTQMFLYSAATYNGHRIHYDLSWARDQEGYDDIVVHGPLQAALLSRAITDWIGGAGRLRRLAVQNRGIAYPGDELRFSGEVSAARVEGDDHLIDLEVRGEKGDGILLMPGTVTVSLPTRAFAERG